MTEPTLRRGSSGSAVQRLQETLASLGFDPGRIDGVFGPGTEEAVRAFQAAHGLEVDGLVGPNTWQALLGGGSDSGPSTTTTSTGQSTIASGELSERRRSIVDSMLPEVVPSTYGESRFTKLTFGLTKDNPNVTPGYTTCGSLPMYIARMLGDKLIGGTNGVRTAGQKKSAWVDADGTKRPRPADLCALLNKDETDRVNGGIAHVGVIVDVSDDLWKTADAGQGDGWAADYVSRQFDAQAGTLSGEVVEAGGARPPRVLAGWIDVDTYPFPKDSP